MQPIFTVYADHELVVFDAQASWTDKAELFTVLRHIDNGRGVKVWELEPLHSKSLSVAPPHVRDVTEDMAIDLAEEQFAAASIEPDTDATDVFCDFCLCNAGDHCDDLIGDAHDAMRERGGRSMRELFA